MWAPSVFIPLKNESAQPNPWVWLVEVMNEDGGALVDQDGSSAILRLNSTSERITWGADAGGTPFVWYPWPINVSPVQSSSLGDASGMNLSMSNANAVGMAILTDNNNLLDHRVNLYIINLAELDNPLAYVKVRGRVVDTAVQAEAITLTLSVYDHSQFDVPTALITRTCRHAYRSSLCGFTGDPGNVELGSCPKTLAACKLRGAWELANGQTVNHPKRFGGAFTAPTGRLPV